MVSGRPSIRCTVVIFFTRELKGSVTSMGCCPRTFSTLKSFSANTIRARSIGFTARPAALPLTPPLVESTWSNPTVLQSTPARSKGNAMHSPSRSTSGIDGNSAGLVKLSIRPPITRCRTTMQFVVRVPVLSEAMVETLPRVSTVPRRVTITRDLRTSCFAMIVSPIVTHTGSPSGTKDTARPMRVVMNPEMFMYVGCWVCRKAIHPMKIVSPAAAARHTKMMTIRRTSSSMVVGMGLTEVCWNTFAITVFVPTAETTPTAEPSTTLVPNQTMLVASRMFSWVVSTVQCTGSFSPVRPELSTRRPLTSTSLRSAGTSSPERSSTTSPTVSSFESTTSSRPSLITATDFGMMSLKLSTTRAEE
eukprot:RCo015895